MSAVTEDGKQALAARGFGTFKRWQRENRKAASYLRSKRGTATERQRNESLAQCLDSELERLIRPNL